MYIYQFSSGAWHIDFISFSCLELSSVIVPLRRAHIPVSPFTVLEEALKDVKRQVHAAFNTALPRTSRVTEECETDAARTHEAIFLGRGDNLG